MSSENIKNRPKKELEFLFKLFKESFKEIDNNKLMENKIKIQFIGDLELLPDDLADLCFKLEEKTKKNNKFKINFAIAYGGRQELIKAVRKIIEEGINFEEINEEVIEEYLYLKDEPDLIIRTGGEKRTSNFLVWQSIYSEWFFLDKMWPEFEKEDLIKCIEEFKTRKRKFGG